MVPRIDTTAPLQFVINSGAGATDIAAKSAVIQSALAEAGRTGELLVCRPSELAQIAAKAAAKAVALNTSVVAVGGDGSLNTVAQAVYAAGGVIGVVPYGTFNYFARTHGVPTEPAMAVRALLAAAPTPVQVSAVNGKIFLVNASLGLYPELLEDREAYKRRFGRSRWVAIAAACTTLLRAQRKLQLHIELGDSARDIRALTLFVGNNRLQLEQLGVSPQDAVRGTPGHGSLAGVVLRPMSTLAMLRLMLHGAMGTLGEAAGVDQVEFEHMVVSPTLAYGKRKTKVAFDGEVAQMATPLDFRVLAKPLYLLKPLSPNPAAQP